MNLLYLSDIRFPMERANGIQTAETCHALARRGVVVDLAVRRNDAYEDERALSFYGLEPHENLRLRRWPATSRPGFLVRALALFLRGRGRWDGVLTRDLVLAELALATKPLHALPVFYEAHTVASVFATEKAGMYAGEAPPSQAKLARLDRRERRVCREASGLFTITQALHAQLVARHGNVAPARVVPDGCRPPGAIPPPSSRNPKRAFYVGQLYPWKGVDVLVEAIGLAGAGTVELVVVGGLPPEPDLDRLRRLAEEKGVSSRVRFTGYVPPDRIEEARRDADLFVIPLLDGATARWFTSPLKLFEAMASGRPIVASDLPSIREVLTHERNALLVPPGNAKALAAALERLARDDALARTLAGRALEDAAAFTWDRRAASIHELLEERLARP